MNSKRSTWKLLLGLAGVGLLVTNCTLQSATDKNGPCTTGTTITGCHCSNNAVGSQTCLADGTYDACSCAIGNEGGASNGGASSAGATSYAGKGGAISYAGSSGAADDAGAGGDSGLVIDPTDCGACLATLCADEWAKCEADNETTVITPGDPYCLSQGANADPGQMELILSCITAERAKGLVKRDAVRACGSTIGQSADPKFFVWAPQGMTPTTENVMNCMADLPDEVDNIGAWATDTANNYPNGVPRAWDDMTCAKLACTSALLP